MIAKSREILTKQNCPLGCGKVIWVSRQEKTGKIEILEEEPGIERVKERRAHIFIVKKIVITKKWHKCKTVEEGDL